MQNFSFNTRYCPTKPSWGDENECEKHDDCDEYEDDYLYYPVEVVEEKKVEEKKVEEKTIEVEEIKEEIKEEVKEKEDIEQPETVDVPIEIKEEEKIDIVEEPKQFFKTSASKSVKRLKK